MRALRILGVLTALLPAAVPAQTTKALPGTVTGHVTLDDTGGPARFAAVTLQPVVTPDVAAPKPGDEPPITLSRVVHTTLDGSFLIPDVTPGNYYVLADADAYLSAAGLLTREQMNHPTKAVAERMARLLVPVAVASGKISTADVRLHRGASLSGTVRFDDGTPFRTSVYLARKNDKGEWAEFHPHLASYNQATDDLGHFRIVGLPAGAYLVRADLSVDEEFLSMRGDQNEGWMSNSLYTLHLYSPGVVRQADAKAYQLTDGQDEANVAIEIPLSKLHSVSGSLIAKGSGHVLNAGHVALLFPDDGKELASVDVSPTDSAFHLAFVPEGTYTLKVTSAQDVERIETQSPPGTMPPTNTRIKVLQTFGNTSEPLIVTTDVPTLLVAVPPAASSTQTPATTP